MNCDYEWKKWNTLFQYEFNRWWNGRKWNPRTVLLDINAS